MRQVYFSPYVRWAPKYTFADFSQTKVRQVIKKFSLLSFRPKSRFTGPSLHSRCTATLALRLQSSTMQMTVRTLYLPPTLWNKRSLFVCQCSRKLSGCSWLFRRRHGEFSRALECVPSGILSTEFYVLAVAVENFTLHFSTKTMMVSRSLISPPSYYSRLLSVVELRMVQHLPCK